MTWTWTKQNASGVGDVAAAARGTGTLTICGTNGTIWYADPGHFTRDPNASGFRRIARSPDGSWLVGVGANGTVWGSKARNQWTQFRGTPALTGVADAVLAYDNSLWVTVDNGQIWSMRDGAHWEWRSVLDPFTRLAVGPGDQWWGVNRAGALLRRNTMAPNTYWTDTPGTGPWEDLSVGSDGTVWLVGRNGSVWHTADGTRFDQVREAAGHRAVSAQGADVVWTAGSNGTVWSYHQQVASPPTPPPPPPPTPRRLQLSVADQSPTFAIDEVVWRVWSQSGGSVALIATASANPLTVNLPAAAQYQVHADVWVYRFGSAVRELAEFVGNGSAVDGIPTLTFVAGDGTTNRSFRLIDTVPDFQNVVPRVVV